MPAYIRPPVVEAVIEVRFADAPLDDKAMETLQRRFQDRYPAPPQQTNNINFEFSGTSLRLSQLNLGMQILSADGTFTVNLGRSALSTVRNAPYMGWEGFMEEARRNWSDWSRVAGWRDVSRIGLRYINRIDVPFGADGGVDTSEYFHFFLNVPPIPGFLGMTSFAVNTEMPMQDRPLKLILNHAPVTSPLVQTNSFLLDLDLSIEQNLPTNESALWHSIEALRSTKNCVFEALITDKTRELFS